MKINNPQKKYKTINGVKYNLTNSTSIYCNRSIIIPGDEEIVLLLGNEMRETDVVDVETAAFLTLPSFLRTYDIFNEMLEIFKEKGIYNKK